MRVDKDRAWLPKSGWVRFRKSREIEGKIKQTTVIKEGKYGYICFACEIEKDNPLLQTEDTIGIDVGLEHFACIATETGIEEIKSPHFLKSRLAKIKYLGRLLEERKKKQKSLKSKAGTECRACQGKTSKERLAAQAIDASC